jgi:hypothetical protein
MTCIEITRRTFDFAREERRKTQLAIVKIDAKVMRQRNDSTQLDDDDEHSP